MPVIQLEALDTLFFRDGKPFTMGEDNTAEGTFPPSPSVIYGALRTAYIAQNLGKNGKTIEDLIADTEGLVITDIILEFGGDDQYPMPLDFVEEKTNKKKKKVFRLKNIPFDDNFGGNSLFKYALYSDEYAEQVSDAAFSDAQMIDYLNDFNTIDKDGVKHWNSLLTQEPKFGNKRGDESRSTSDDDGNVYRVALKRLEVVDYEDSDEKKGMITRPKQLKINVEYSLGNEMINDSLIRVGGEGKSMKLRNLNSNNSIKTPTFSDDSHFRIYLKTPSLFENGYLPDLNKIFVQNGFDVELLTAAIGKPIQIGGWDVKNKEPKAMIKAVPAGSVYHFKIKNGGTNIELFEKMRNIKSISDFGKGKEGFGLFFMTNLDIQKHKYI